MKEKSIRYHALSPRDFEGKGWQNTRFPFDRVPSKCENTLPNVWRLGHSPTGMCVYFNSDTASVSVRYELGEDQLGEPNFNFSAFSGVDLYIFDETQKRWRWAALTHFSAITGKKIETALLKDMPKKPRRYLLYLPLRNQMLKIAVGVDRDASFEKVPPRREKLLVYYGTSIIHGAYAIRSGTGTAQRLARMLDLPLINLGFSGAAKLEKEMAELLAELDAKVFVVDPYHNLTPELAKQNTENFIRTLCTLRPDVPVFMIGAPPRLGSWIFPDIREEERAKTRIYGNVCRRMKKVFPNLHYLKGEDFYGSDEVSTDGTHPNDEAFAHMSRILFREVSRVLNRK